MKVDDAPNDFLSVANGTQSNGQFIPVLLGQHLSDNREAISVNGLIGAGNDSGNVPVMTFDSRRTDSKAVQVRPLFAWNSYGQRRMTMDAEGNLGIGESDPLEALHITRNSSTRMGIRIFNSLYGNNQGTMFLMKTGGSYVVTDQRNAGLVESYNDLILSAAQGTGSINPSIRFQTGRIGYTGNTRMVIDSQGNVGIGTTEPDSELTVAGKIHAREVKIDTQAGADFVFERDYELMDLSNLEAYVRKHKHLPEIAPAKEMEENGVNTGEFQIQLLQKIEELTLYAIEQEKVIKAQRLEIMRINKKSEKEILTLRTEIENIKQLLSNLK
ncbi:hypothetical protein FUAX_53130 (plasmid) [Fulvitalea axinellae]|uniref:Peptidase S74 domain-containing protein n=1 Tax=Fulvitalea axinellae TaxID=1182444 RepID=A0AAU9DIC8_9BACT|nr:hypothetical protein FUAX_53130 [Fulvitalea axinellae]